MNEAFDSEVSSLHSHHNMQFCSSPPHNEVSFFIISVVLHNFEREWTTRSYIRLRS